VDSHGKENAGKPGLRPMQEWVLRTPSSAAVSNNQTTLSYAELEDRVARCAAFLSDHGLADHDVCALDISDRMFFVICCTRGSGP